MKDTKILHIPATELKMVDETVRRSKNAFYQMSSCSDENINNFFKIFADNLKNPEIANPIYKANLKDLEIAKAKGKSTVRLELKEKYMKDMIDGLLNWIKIDLKRNKVINTVQRDGFEVDEVMSPYGIVAFVFEARPNVFTDACGVLKMGNTSILRIGSDATNTAKTIMEIALKPALFSSGLPKDALMLLESQDHSSAWALFSNKDIGLAVARGSGPTVLMLGEIARSNGIPVSLHGTGGAWMIVDEEADLEKFEKYLYNSLDRKVCNTTNTVCILKKNGSEAMKKVFDAISKRAHDLSSDYKVHYTDPCSRLLPVDLSKELEIKVSELRIEWEWEQNPEISVHVVENLQEAAELFNKLSPRFVASLISENQSNHEKFFKMIDSPFVGDGFTRWVDGQYCLNSPELGLSNWEYGRLFGRSGILSGTSIYTVRLRMRQLDKNLCR